MISLLGLLKPRLNVEKLFQCLFVLFLQHNHVSFIFDDISLEMLTWHLHFPGSYSANLIIPWEFTL